MTMIRSTLFNILFYTMSFLVAMVCWALAHLSTRTSLWYPLRFWGKATLVLMRVLLNARVEVRGLEHYDPKRSQVLVSKHQSELDIVMLAVTFWDITAIAMKELEKLPFFGALLRKIDAVTIAVDAGPQGRTQQAIDGAKRIRSQNRSIVIYPEGELMNLGAKERYRRGVGHVYGAMEVEAVPIALSHGAVWPQRQWLKHPGHVAIMELMEPIPPGMEFETFMETIEDRIETRTMELIEESASGDVLQDARDRHARGADNET